jgi:hypothetical protein
MTKISLLTALMLAAGTMGTPVHADSLLRCGQRLLASGDSTVKVRAACGEPAATATRRVVRSVPRVAYVQCEPGSPALCRRAVHDLVEIEIVEWTYDFGPRRFMRFVTFEQGKLLAVETGGYGGDR